MVGIVIVSHSVRLAEGVAELAREMAGDVPIVTAGGLAPPAPGEPSPLGTDAARVMAAIEEAAGGADAGGPSGSGGSAGGDGSAGGRSPGSGDSARGVLVLMDLGSAVLSAEMAVDLLEPGLAERVLLVAAPLVEGAVAAAVAAQAGQSLAQVAAEARGGLAGKQAHLGESADDDLLLVDGSRAPSDDDPQRAAAAGSDALEERFVVTVAQGLHARPAARFVRAAAALDARIEVENATTGAGPASATSLNAIATLGVREGHELLLRATGPDAAAAVAQLRTIATVERGGDRSAASADRTGEPGAGDPDAGGTTTGSPDTRGAGSVGASAGGSDAGGVDPSGAGHAHGADGAFTGDAGSDSRRAPGADAGSTGHAPTPTTDDAGDAGSRRALPSDAPADAIAGIASSPGIAIGPLQLLVKAGGGAPSIAEEPSGTPEQEWAALAAARDTVRDEIGVRRAALARALGEEEAEILDALALMLDDDVLLGPAREAVERRGVSAARAWADAVDAVAARYDALEDAYQRERAGDLRDVGRRVLAALSHGNAPAAPAKPAPSPSEFDPRRSPCAMSTENDPGRIPAVSGADPMAGPAAMEADPAATPPAAPAILVARELTPLDAAGLDRANVAGIATAQGGPTSHGAILARALGVPAVVGLGDGILELAAATTTITTTTGVVPTPAASGVLPAADPNTRSTTSITTTDAAAAPEPPTPAAILDGDAGLLIPSPDPATRAAYERRRDDDATAARQARARAHEPATTRDGVAIEVAANAGGPADAREGVAQGADGVGLLRTEFAFLDRAQAPTEDEQVAIYSAAAQALDGRPLVIRTLDAGADKPVPYLAMPSEDNPFLGVRGIRLGLARPELLTRQLRAIVRTAALHPNVKPMFPMIATIEELRAARALLERARAEVGEPLQPGFEVGIMVEVPAAALTAVTLAREADFLSLGTNDLTQYVLAAERGNAALAQLSDGLHPAVLRLVDEVCRAARAHGRWVGVCGELAADPVALPLLVGLGVRELSVAAPSVPAVKAAVRLLDAGDAEVLARAALAAESAAAVRTLAAAAAAEARST